MRDLHFSSYCEQRDSQELMWEMICIGADIEKLIVEIDSKYPGVIDAKMLQEQMSGKGAGWGALAGGLAGTMVGAPMLGAAAGGALGGAAPAAWGKIKDTWNNWQAGGGAAGDGAAGGGQQGGEAAAGGEGDPVKMVNVMRKTVEFIKHKMGNTMGTPEWAEDSKTHADINNITKMLDGLEAKLKTKFQPPQQGGPAATPAATPPATPAATPRSAWPSMGGSTSMGG